MCDWLTEPGIADTYALLALARSDVTASDGRQIIVCPASESRSWSPMRTEVALAVVAIGPTGARAGPPEARNEPGQLRWGLCKDGLRPWTGRPGPRDSVAR